MGWVCGDIRFWILEFPKRDVTEGLVGNGTQDRTGRSRGPYDWPIPNEVRNGFESVE